jgi:hypothetical protein
VDLRDRAHLLAGWYRRETIELSAMKRLGIERPALEAPEHERLIELGGLATQRERVARWLLELPEDQRAAVQLREVDARSYTVLLRCGNNALVDGYSAKVLPAGRPRAVRLRDPLPVFCDRRPTGTLADATTGRRLGTFRLRAQR